MPVKRLPPFNPAAVNVLVFLAGLLLLAVGLSLWYFPAGLVAAGVVLICAAVFDFGGEEKRA